MTTRRLALTAALALALALAACGDDSGDDSGSGSASASASGSASAPSETTTTLGAEAGADTDAAGEAVSTVFDSSVPFDEKVALVQDGEAHRAAHDGYVAAAQAVGGITVEPTGVTPSGDTATVTYRVLFGGNQAYDGLTMDVAKVGDAWVVPTEAFCGFLQAARVTCTQA
jgi:hypothetical protein